MAVMATVFAAAALAMHVSYDSLLLNTVKALQQQQHQQQQQQQQQLPFEIAHRSLGLNI